MNSAMFHQQSAVMESAQILLFIGFGCCPGLLPPSWIDVKLLLTPNSADSRRLSTHGWFSDSFPLGAWALRCSKVRVWAWQRSLPCVRCMRSCGPSRRPWRLDHAAWWRDPAGLCAAAHSITLCTLQEPLQGSGPLPGWRELTRQARCARGAN